MKVSELMSTPAVTCLEEDTLHLAASLMLDRDCGAIPIVDMTESIIGMITDRDICMAAHATGRTLKEIAVAEITSGKVFSVDASDTVTRAAEVMREHQVRRLPVVDIRDRIVGVISLIDIARAGQGEAGQDIKSVTGSVLLRTLAAIGEPPAGHAHVRT